MIKPRNHCVVVEVDPRIKETKEGIVLGYGQIERDEILWGTVLQVGPKCPDGLEVGDRVPLRRGSCWLDLSHYYGGREVLMVKAGGDLENGGDQIEAVAR